MTNYVRPDPDEILAQVQKDERLRGRGRLLIFLGYAAGVGKTYAMLQAAQQRRAEGVDVVVGYVETHGRAETDALLAGLEIMPRREIPYRGATLSELDLDASLARRPQLVLIDEYAHTNAPGARHPKRYQDAEEMLASGIDVYTTLNIQHLESLNDAVAQVTGIIVRETIPDSALDEATEIKLVDLPPDELLQRLREGKVYVPEQAARATEQFFRKGNLTALREMALRRAAQRVDDQMLAYMQTRSIPGPWPAGERLLVCVGSNPLGERLVRSARRLADELGAEWSAIYVETGAYARLSEDERTHIARTLRLAEELGAEAVTLPGQSVAEAVLEYARKHNITKVIAGKSLHPGWREWFRSPIVQQLIRASGPIDVYVISAEAVKAPVLDRRGWLPHRPWRRYAQSALLVFGATVIGAPFSLHFTPTNLVMLYLVAVVIAAVYFGRGPSILASVLAVLAFDFFFVPPKWTFVVADTQYILTFIGLFVVSLVISSLAAQAREQAEAARHRESQTAELYALSRDLAGVFATAEIVEAVVRHVEQTFERQAIVLLPQDGRLVSPVESPVLLDPNEEAVADWVYRRGEPAGRNTNTLPAANLRYLPLKTARGTIGVLGIAKPLAAGSFLTPEQHRLMEAFASQAAMAVDRAGYAEQARKSEVLQATEQLQAALLNSISHDLRTPLVSITGALSSLEEEGDSLDSQTRSVLIENAREEAERLNRLVGNLLDMTRLEAGAMKLRLEPGDLQDVIGSALTQLETRLGTRQVVVDVGEDLPPVPMDFALISQVLVNLLDNALKYSPPESPIEVKARLAGAYVEIEVADRGTGIPPEDLSRVFDKFYRVRRPGSVSGTGLGLSICQGIVQAHRGFIVAENRSGGGTAITVALPVA